MLAESWKLLDERTGEFQLRRGVKFHDGDDFTASDVVFSFEAYKSGKGILEIIRERKLLTEPQIADLLDPVKLTGLDRNQYRKKQK